MEQIQLARVIEETAYRSWKARECFDYDGWQLRYADGFSRRGNSVYPAETSSLPYDEKLERCRRFYHERGLDLVVRQTVATESGLDEVLAASGFGLEGRTDVMTGTAEATNPSLSVSSSPSPQWWETISNLWGFDSADPCGWRGIIERIDLPAGFACVAGEGAGLAIVDDEWVGLFEIIVAPGSRRLGLGSALTKSLLAWGASRGAGRSYLQVVAENEPAIGFYQHLGFTHAYTYWYRRDQPENRPA